MADMQAFRDRFPALAMSIGGSLKTTDRDGNPIEYTVEDDLRALLAEQWEAAADEAKKHGDDLDKESGVVTASEQREWLSEAHRRSAETSLAHAAGEAYCIEAELRARSYAIRRSALGVALEEPEQREAAAPVAGESNRRRDRFSVASAGSDCTSEPAVNLRYPQTPAERIQHALALVKDLRQWASECPSGVRKHGLRMTREEQEYVADLLEKLIDDSRRRLQSLVSVIDRINAELPDEGP